MKKIIIFFTIALFGFPNYAQVGINNTDPKASLDITATNQANPSNTDGLLIPRIDTFPTTNPTAAQQGMMVYLTTISGYYAPGYYYWDNNAGPARWVVVGDKNTLNQAYYEGGPGAGRTINALNGAVSIAGRDGFQVTGVYNDGADLTLSGSGTRMFFNPRKAAFRAGYVDGNQWNLGNVGPNSFASGYNTIASGYQSTAMGRNTTASKTYSVAMGGFTTASGNSSTAMGAYTTASGSSSTAMGDQTIASGITTTAMGRNTTASGNFSTAMGRNTTASNTYSVAMGYQTTASGTTSTAMGTYTTASGNSSTAMGRNTTAFSFGETTIGSYSTTYTPNSTSTWNASDRLFVIGNGLDDANRSNALTVYKNGLLNINDAYNMPLTDGTTNQIMQTDGAGQVSFVDPTGLQDADWHETGGTPPNSINDNIYTYGNVGIGTTAISNAALHIKKNSTGSSPQLNLAESQANDGARINFTNSVETTNLWTLYARSDNTSTSNYFNVYNTVGGNILTIRGNGKVGINRTPNTNALEVNGQASKSSAGSWIANSDRRLKKDIAKIEGKTALDKIMKMKGVTYLWNDTQTGINRPTEIQYGFIAQELMQVFPEKVTKDNLGYYQTAYGDYDPIFVEAIKELNTKIEVLETENQQLKQQIAKYEDLEARLSALENNNIITNND